MIIIFWQLIFFVPLQRFFQMKRYEESIYYQWLSIAKGGALRSVFFLYLF